MEQLISINLVKIESQKVRKLLKENIAVIRFVFTFAGVYILLVLLYAAYLEVFPSEKYYPDYITHLVAQQTEALVDFLGYNARILPHLEEPSMKLFVNNLLIARIIEGCNSISVILLFIAFILAFWTKWKPTLLYIFAGSVLIYVTNIIRIAILAIGIYEYPDYAEVLHGTVFPAIIYGMVFLLWLLWIFKFSKFKK